MFLAVWKIYFCRSVPCTRFICTCNNTQALHPRGCPTSALPPLLAYSLNLHFCCHHSTMTERKVIPLHEFEITLCHVHNNDSFFMVPPFLSFTPRMSCMAAGFHICCLSWWSDTFATIFSAVLLPFQQRSFMYYCECTRS